MNWNFFNKTPEVSPLDKHNQLFIEKVTEMLESNPENFSAKWFNGTSLDSSVQSKNGNILIMIKTGQITHPVSVEMNYNQKEIIKNLISTIVERDSKSLIEKFLKSN